MDKLGFSGEKIVKKRFRGILKNPPITPKLFNRFLKINSAQIVFLGATKQHITIFSLLASSSKICDLLVCT